MKKIVSILLALVTVLSMGTAAFADGTTTLTTTVPDATYTLNIPADVVVPFGQEITNLENLTVTDSSGFATGKNLEVTVTYDAFKADSPDITTTIPFELIYDSSTTLNQLSTAKPSGGVFKFLGKSNGSTQEQAFWGTSGSGYVYVKYMGIHTESSDWGKALAGDYTAKINFTSEVVVEQ